MWTYAWQDWLEQRRADRRRAEALKRFAESIKDIPALPSAVADMEPKPRVLVRQYGWDYDKSQVKTIEVDPC